MSVKIPAFKRNEERGMSFIVPWGTYAQIQHAKNLMRLTSNTAWLKYAAAEIEKKVVSEQAKNHANG